MTTLDVSALTELGRFGCGNNQFTELDVTNNTKLTFLSAEGNQLTRLDLRNLDATSYSATIGGNSGLALLIKTGATPTVSMYCAKAGYTAAFSWSNGTTTHRCQYSGAPLLGTATPTETLTLSAAMQKDGYAVTYAWLDGSTTAETTFAGPTSCTTTVTSDTDPATWGDCFVFAENVKGEKVLTDVGNNDSMEGKELAGALDLSGCAALVTVDVENNALTSIDVSGCTALYVLTLDINPISSLDVSDSPALKYLYTNYANLTTLDVSANLALERLDFCATGIELLDLTKLRNIKELTIGSPDLTILMGTKYPKLRYGAYPVGGYTAAYKWSNRDSGDTCTPVYDDFASGLTGSATYTKDGAEDVVLKVSCFSIPQGYNVHDYMAVVNFLAQKNANGVMNMQKLGQWMTLNEPDYWCTMQGKMYFTFTEVDGENVLTSVGDDLVLHGKNLEGELNVSDCTNLTSVDVGSNALTGLKVDGCGNLTKLSCGANQFNTLDVTQNPLLKELSCGSLGLTTLDVTQNSLLTSLVADNNSLTSLDISNNLDLEYFYVTKNQLTEVNLTPHTKLIGMDVAHNRLTALDVSDHTFLKQAGLVDNLVSDLNISGCAALEELYCSDNQLTSLDLAPFAFLMNLTCANNQLTELDLTQNAMISSVTAIGDDLRVYLPAAMGENTFLCIKQERFGCDEAYLWTDGSNDFAREHAENLVYPITGTLTLTSQADPTDVETLSTRFYAVPAGYDVKEYIQMVDFLETETTAIENGSEVTKKNGVWFNENYNSADPATWPATFAEDADGVKHVEKIDFNRTVLGGALDCSDMALLTTVIANGSQLTSVDFADCAALQDVQLYGCKSLETLNLTDCAALESLSVQSCKLLTTLDVSDCAALTELNAAGAGLTTLDQVQNLNLENLDVSNTSLSVLDLRANTALKFLQFASPSLKAVYLSEDIIDCTLDASYNENDGTTFQWKNAGTTGPQLLLADAESVPEICTITANDGTSFTTVFLLHDPVSQNGRKIEFGSTVAALPGEKYTFQLKVSNLPDTPNCWQKISTSVDEYGFVTASVDSARFWNEREYDIRIVDSEGNILKEDTFTATKLTTPTLQTKVCSTTEFMVIPTRTDNRASDFAVTYRVYSNKAWSEWNTTRMSELLELGWVVSNPDGTYCVKNLPVGSKVQFKTYADGEYFDFNKTLYLDSAAVTKTVSLPQPKALARVTAKAVATDVDALTLTVTRIDANADGVQYRYKETTSKVWSDWAKSTDPAIAIAGFTPGAKVQIQILANTEDPANFKNSAVSTVNCTLISNKFVVPTLRKAAVDADSATIQITNWSRLTQLLDLAGDTAAFSVSNGVDATPVVFTFDGTAWVSSDPQCSLNVGAKTADIVLGNLNFNTTYTFNVTVSGAKMVSAVSRGLKIKTLNVV